MNESTDIIRHAFLVILYLSGPALIVAAVVGVLVGILQSVTQIQDQSISYAIKMVAVAVTLLLCAGWIEHSLVDLLDRIFDEMPTIGESNPD